METSHPRFRIGELARRTGVSPALLRAWETRYHLLNPSRSAGGFRLYSEEDETRVRRMRSLQEEGLSASEAARSALTGDWSPAEVPATTLDEPPRSYASRSRATTRSRRRRFSTGC
jgi:MerR family transcriptional regulator, light-induced transcriptional regulator